MKTEILSPSVEVINYLARELKKDHLVAIPTETVYGLAGLASSETALLKIFSTKERPRFDPLILHVAWGFDDVKTQSLILWNKFTPKAKELLTRLQKSFWPGPLTLVLHKASQVSDIATSGLDDVGLRMPKHPIALQLISEVGEALAAPSANRFGKVSPTQALHVVDELNGRIAWVLDGGACEIGIESTVAKLNLEGTKIEILRPGAVTLEQIKSVVGDIEVTMLSTKAKTDAPPLSSPGQLLSHYAPNKPLWLLPKPVLELSDIELGPILKRFKGPLGLLIFQGDSDYCMERFRSLGHPEIHVWTLTPSGSLEEAAKGLFKNLRILDQSNAQILFAEPLPESTHSSGLGYAITDRLNRAGKKIV